MKKLLGTLVGIALITGAYSLAPIEEDSPAFNCYLHGNHVCGTAPHILGFIY